jgi:hypothetical protein
MNRRRFVIGTTAVGGIAIAGGATLLLRPRTSGDLTLNAVAENLESFRGKQLLSHGKWSAAHIFSHNAQSINYSMAGFPKKKGPVFQTLLGKPAFAVFSAWGEMHHGLAEPIPGAYAIEDDIPLDSAIDELLASIAIFTAYTDALKPHFAYGELNKADYESAHVLHFLNHMREITVQSV